MPKPKPALGFDLTELATEVDRYDAPTSPASRREPTAAPATRGRPRSLDEDTAPMSVRLSGAQRDWLLREAARRTLATGERHDVSRLVRELIDQARAA